MQQEQKCFVGIERGLQFFVGQANAHSARKVVAPKRNRLRAKVRRRTAARDGGPLRETNWLILVTRRLPLVTF
jgi:hypothetical protein